MHTKVMEITSPSQFRAVEKMISGGGPVTLVLVWSKTCPHCHTYMPLWKELTRTKSKATNMISIEAPVYQASPLAAKKEISSVPTVLYVDEKGEIQEVEDARNKTLMSNIVRTASPPDVAEAMTEDEVAQRAPTAVAAVRAPAEHDSALAVNAKQRAPAVVPTPSAPSVAAPSVAAPSVAAPSMAAPSMAAAPAPLSMNAMRRTSNAKPPTPPEIEPAIPGTEVVPNPLPISPGATMSTEEAADSLMPEQPKPQVGGAKPQVGGAKPQVGGARQKQVGGNMASMIAQAAPVAILAGAYSMFGNRRSSGLPPARRTRRRGGRGRSRRVRFSRRYRR